MAVTLFLTHRGPRHQQRILSSAPAELNLQITMLRDASKPEILRLIPAAEFLISEREDIIDAEMIAAARNLRLIQRLGSQTYDIDLPAAKAAGIPVCYWPDLSTINVAEHCLMQTLGLLKKTREMGAVMSAADWNQPTSRSDEDTFAYNWSARQGVGTLWGKTAGILGFGEIGRELAGMLKGFNARVLYNKRRPMPVQAERELAVTFATPDDLLHQSEVVYCLLPFSPETAQSIDASVLAKMKPGAVFVFCGGSGIVNEDDLVAALRCGQLSGAALDTFTFEPLPKDSSLLRAFLEPLQPGGPGPLNLLLTPHTAAGTQIGSRRSEYTNLLRLAAGEPLLYQVA